MSQPYAGRLTPSQEHEAIRLLKHGLSRQAIAATLHVPVAWLSRNPTLRRFLVGGEP